MKLYVVRIESVATKDNPNFAGQEVTSYFGKRDTMLAAQGSHAEACHYAKPLTSWWVKEYGYKRRCDAERNWSYRNPENTKYWTSTATIEAIEI